MPSRSGPRKPGQEKLEFAAFEGDGTVSGLSSAKARSRSSGVGVHRQWKSESPSPDIPPVRRSVNTPHASRMVPTIEARRGPLDKRRLATAQHTKARLRTGMAQKGNSIPIAPLAMDG